MRGINIGQDQNSAPGKVTLASGERGILAHDLMVEIMGTVPVFGGKKVHVGFYGNMAFASEQLNYINIPQLPQGLIIPQRIAMEIRGFAAHEAAHLLWTDFSVFDRLLTDDEKKNKLLKETWNALEDYMIERNWLVIYPGSHKNFTATEIRCCDEYMVHYRKNPDIAKDLRIIGPIALTWCRALHFGLQTPAPADALKTMPPTLQQRVQQWFYDALDVETTEECLEHARKIIADIDAAPFDPLDPPSNPNHDPLGNSPLGSGGPGGFGGAGGGGAGPGAFGGSRGQNQGGGQGQGPTPMKVGHNIGAAFEDLHVEPPENGHVSFAVPSTLESGPMAEALRDPAGVQRAQEASRAVAGTTAVVARVMKRILKTISRDRWKGGREEGLIEDKRLANVVLGATEIYKKKVKGEAVDTAVSILVDCSGSMGGTLPICQQMALVLYKSFAGTPVQFEILGYTSADDDHLPEPAKVMSAAIKQQMPNAEPEIRSVEIYEFKGFDAPHHVAMTTIGNMDPGKLYMGGTPTADAILIAHERLSRRKERRHVMIVLSDGQPDDVDACKEAVNAVEQCGVTVFAFGIESDAVKHAFRNWAQISQASDMAAIVLAKLAGVVFGERHLKGIQMKHKPTHIRHAA